MMEQYRDRTFAKDRLQWSKCVVNYMLDAFAPDPIPLIVFTSEVGSF